MQAQNRQISGQVISAEDNYPVIGANVLIKGTSQGVISDLDGNFILTNVPESADKLIISYIGMKTLEQKIQPKMRIVLHPDTELLDEVVVVGYGTAKKIGTVVGALSTVNSEKIETTTSANLADGLQGQIPGLQIYTSSGEPSAVSKMELRGKGSLTTDNSPLFVLDGTPVSEAVFNTLNSNDIENIVVLKDASATSIYGSRAANGVIYITSKKGRLGESTLVNISTSYGFSNLARNVGNPMNSKELLSYQLGNQIISQSDYDKYLASGIDTNWQRYFFKKNRPTYNANISIQGGGDKTRYYVSGSYYSKEGLVANSDFDRYTFRTNLESTAYDWLKLGTSIGLSYNEAHSSSLTSLGRFGKTNAVRGTTTYQPYYSPYDEHGNRLQKIPGINEYDPNYLESKSPSKSNTTHINNSTFIQLAPITGLTLRSQLGIEAFDVRSSNLMLSSYPGASGIGSANEGLSRSATLSITNTAEYKFNIDKIHDFTVLIGHEGIKNHNSSLETETEGQSDDRLPGAGSGTVPVFLVSRTHYKSRYTFLSFFGRIDYALMGKYYFDFSVRNDGSSRFGKNNKHANFFSGGFMWDLKSEKWIKSIEEITSLQFKASVGSTGNSAIGNYSHYATVGSLGSSYDGIDAWSLMSAGNKDLGWETQIITNVGLDITLLNRFNFNINYYHRKTNDMLMDVILPGTTGFMYSTINIGGLVNRGIEIGTSLDIYRDKNWFVNFSANYAYNKQKITHLSSGVKEWYFEDSFTMLRVGEPSQFYIPVYAGVDPEDGLQMWKVPGTNEVTKDKNLVASGKLHQTVNKKLDPPHSGGFSLAAGWNGLVLNADFSWVYGKYMMNYERFYTENPINSYGENQSKALLNEWKKPGDITSIPKYGEVRVKDTHLLENASFLRLKNISLSYSLPKNLLDKTKFFKSVKFTINARNLLTATSFKGADPESISTVSYGGYPNTKEFTFGTDITF